MWVSNSGLKCQLYALIHPYSRFQFVPNVQYGVPKSPTEYKG